MAFRQITSMKAQLLFALTLANVLAAQAQSAGPAPSSNAVVTWGESVEGVSVRLHPGKTTWASHEVPTFRFDASNKGQREFYTFQSQESGRLEVDGIWYNWTGAFRLKGSAFPPGREYRDIPVSLARHWYAKQEWNDKSQAPPPQVPLRLTLGKHTVRYAPEIRGITVKPKPRNTSVPSNPVEIEIREDVRNSAEPAGASNRSQPVGPRANGTSVAAGSGR
jgi:hypothetical protein